MKLQYLVSGLAAALFLVVTSPAMSEERTLDEAKAEIERLEQENQSLQEQLDTNEATISDYKAQMADIEEQITQLQSQAGQ